VRLLTLHDQRADLAKVIAALPRPTVVLCATPAQADEVYARLQAENVPTHRFHEKMPPADRARELLHFALPGRRAILVAVSSFGPSSGFEGEAEKAVPESFGAGYARKDVRSMVHLCAPCSLVQYANELNLLSHDAERESDAAEQERATTALLLFSGSHLVQNLALLERKRPSGAALLATAEVFFSASKGAWLSDLEVFEQASVRCGEQMLAPRQVRKCLHFLVDSGVLRTDGVRFSHASDAQTLRRTAQDLAQSLDQLRSGDQARLSAVEDYATSTQCRMTQLEVLLGLTRESAETTAPCGRCSVCDPDTLSTLLDAPTDEDSREVEAAGSA
jgi:hypothetical protein